jgi:hypothetical protein
MIQQVLDRIKPNKNAFDIRVTRDRCSSYRALIADTSRKGIHNQMRKSLFPERWTLQQRQGQLTPTARPDLIYQMG